MGCLFYLFHLIGEINKYFLTKIIEKEDIVLSVKKNFKIEETNVKSFKQLIKTPKKSVIARSEKQSDYIKALKENEIIMSLGPAGTGKSFLAVSLCIKLYSSLLNNSGFSI